MRAAALETFLLGVTCGIGMMVLALYTQKPGPLVSSVETIAAKGRARRAKEEENRLQRGRLKAVGFSDEEIDEYFG